MITEFLEVANKPVPDELSDELGLYAGGLELDSLQAAELSALLEDEFGSDPFSSALAAGEDMPETVGEVVAFYGVTSAR
ncbi:MAG TPA: phosphopantetheine-binding protein [Solirubrobacterales bacterium]